MTTYRTTYHRDGTITVWDVYLQAWRRLAATDVGDEILASLPASERARIARHADRQRADFGAWRCARCRQSQREGADYYETSRGGYWCAECAVAAGRELSFVG
jgi:late competence protein required for DNA uptake (superfamily II DNA/RNA helicase)